MKIKLAVLSIFLLFCFSLSVRSAEEWNSGIVYGPNHAFFISAPKDWVLDNESGIPDGLHAVFYPVGSSWKKSDIVMYANGFSKPENGDRSLKGFIEADVANFKEKNPEIRIESGKELITVDGKKATVLLFTGDKWGNHESVAYIEEEKCIITLVLSTKSDTLFKKSQTAFDDLVKSYRFFTDKVEIK
jgi:hypothetical protein